MSSQLATVGGRPVLLAGSWRIAESASEVKAARAALPRGAIVMALVHGPERVMVSYEGIKASGTVYSAGAVVAHVASTAFVSHPLEDGRRWVFACVNGVALPGFDRVVRPTDVSALLAEACVGGMQFERIGDLPGAERTLEAVLSSAESAVWRVAAHKHVPRTLIPAAFAAVVLVGSGVAWALTQDPRTDSQATTVAAIPAPAASTAASASSAPAAAASAPAAPTRTASTDMVRAAFAVLHRLPSSTDGWTAEQVTCQSATGKCEVVWVAAPGALAEDARQIPNVALSMDVATTRRALSSEEFTVSSKPLTAVPHDDALTLYTTSAQNRLGTIDFQGNSASPAGVTVPFKAAGELWMWKSLAFALDRDAITTEEVIVQKLGSTAPTLTLTGSAAVAAR